MYLLTFIGGAMFGGIATLFLHCCLILGKESDKQWEDDSVLEAVINRYEKEVESAVEFEKVFSNDKLYYGIKALSLKEKIVLFSLYKQNKTINQIALEMKTDRTTIWRIKNKTIDKLMKYLIGGKENV